MSKFKVEVSGIDTSKLKVLTNEEMEELFKRYKNGDKDAKEKLVEGNLKLVLSIIGKYRYKEMDMNDLFQVGCIGLIKAVDNFDTGYGVMFSTYAVPLILGEVRRLIRSNTPIRIARSIRDTAYAILKYKEEYTLLYGIEPRPEEICTHLHITEFELKNASLAMQDPVSIFEPIYNDGGDTIFLLDQISDPKSAENVEMSIELEEALKKIKEKEKNVLVMRYILGKTQNEIAEELGVSQAQVSRIEKSASENLRKYME